MCVAGYGSLGFCEAGCRSGVVWNFFGWKTLGLGFNVGRFAGRKSGVRKLSIRIIMAVRWCVRDS